MVVVMEMVMGLILLESKTSLVPFLDVHVCTHLSVTIDNFSDDV